MPDIPQASIRTNQNNHGVRMALRSMMDGVCQAAMREMETPPVAMHVNISYLLLFGRNHLQRFGLTMHVGRGGAASKTEAMYLHTWCWYLDDLKGDASSFTVDGGSVSFGIEFRYLELQMFGFYH